MLALQIHRRVPMRPSAVRGRGPDAGTSARAAPVFPRLVKAESEEGNLWLHGRRLIRFESASANVGAEGWAAPAEHIWNNPPAPPGECFHSGHAATLQLTLVKTAYKQDHASSSLLVQEANGGCRYRCHSAWKNTVRSACTMGNFTHPPISLLFFFTSPACNNTFPAPLPSLCVGCFLYYCNSKLNAQLQHSPSNINLAGSHTSIINVCIAAEDSCIAPSWRITAPALSFLKRWQQGWKFAGGGVRGAVSTGGAGKTSHRLNRHKQDWCLQSKCLTLSSRAWEGSFGVIEFGLRVWWWHHCCCTRTQVFSSPGWQVIIIRCHDTAKSNDEQRF